MYHILYLGLHYAIQHTVTHETIIPKYFRILVRAVLGLPLCLVVAQLVVFIGVYNKMKHYHNYEYRRNRQHLRMQFTLSLSILIYILVVYFDMNTHESGNQFIKCQSYEKDFEIVVFLYMNAIEIVLCFIVVRIKSS